MKNEKNGMKNYASQRKTTSPIDDAYVETVQFWLRRKIEERDLFEEGHTEAWFSARELNDKFTWYDQFGYERSNLPNTRLLGRILTRMNLVGNPLMAGVAPRRDSGSVTRYLLIDPDMHFPLFEMPGLIQFSGCTRSFQGWTALSMAVAVSEGRDFLGKRTAKTKVLYLSGKSKGHELKSQIECLTEKQSSNFYCCSIKDFEEATGSDPISNAGVLEEIIKQKGYGAVFIDDVENSSLITDGNEEQIEAQYHALEAISQSQSVTIILMHSRPERPAPRPQTTGSIRSEVKENNVAEIISSGLPMKSLGDKITTLFSVDAETADFEQIAIES